MRFSAEAISALTTFTNSSGLILPAVISTLVTHSNWSPRSFLSWIKCRESPGSIGFCRGPRTSREQIAVVREFAVDRESSVGIGPSGPDGGVIIDHRWNKCVLSQLPSGDCEFGVRWTFVKRSAIPPKRSSAFARADAAESPNAGATLRHALSPETSAAAAMIDLVE